MPRHSYSNANQPEQQPLAITEPGTNSGLSRGASWEDESYGVHAKEPDRQSTARRSTASRRSRAAMEEEDQAPRTQPRGRTSARGNSARGSQARRASVRGATSRTASGGAAKASRGKKSRRGFAAMSSEQQREIARKGGLTVSRNRRHMADIGRIGGEHSHGGRRSRR